MTRTLWALLVALTLLASAGPAEAHGSVPVAGPVFGAVVDTPADDPADDQGGGAHHAGGPACHVSAACASFATVEGLGPLAPHAAWRPGADGPDAPAGWLGPPNDRPPVL
ncbi:MAG: hypothetical protein NXI21_14965 [Alphaproteobacteria bacterium]|nr:hypothetical protein [Alphaproteobacteria bacterium]